MDFNYGRLRGLTVLIVEDDWLLRQEIFEELTKADCFILEASTGEYAVTLLEGDRRIDFLITDIELAGPMTGWEVAERGRAHRPDIPIVYTSGNTDTEGHQVSGSRLLNKPCAMINLLKHCAEIGQSSRPLN